MPTVPLLPDDDASPAARAVFDDIRARRNTDYVNNFWRALANDPPLLQATWERLQQVMAPGALLVLGMHEQLDDPRLAPDAGGNLPVCRRRP